MQQYLSNILLLAGQALRMHWWPWQYKWSSQTLGAQSSHRVNGHITFLTQSCSHYFISLDNISIAYWMEIYSSPCVIWNKILQLLNWPSVARAVLTPRSLFWLGRKFVQKNIFKCYPNFTGYGFGLPKLMVFTCEGPKGGWAGGGGVIGQIWHWLTNTRQQLFTILLSLVVDHVSSTPLD